MSEDPISQARFSGTPAAGAAGVAPENGARPVAVFSTGWGDGFYPTWLGRDERGDVTVVMTDFLLTGDPYAVPEEPVETSAAVSTPPRWKRMFRRRG